ncbi:MAG: thiamine pyrophosphate protein domain protein TPP-binding [Brevundimonas sp.]|nr:thiamine pyrophosphate protein domain protein TPP-binding [Brevundimonas sp.]
MNGAESLVRSLAASGVEVCFTNPGTSEMHLVAALETAPLIRPVLTLFENVATGAADGYARISGKPAVTLLHLGVGLANGLSNLHNARKAGSPIVNIIGEHASHHGGYDTPLSSDIAGYAAPVSHWVRSSRGADVVGADGALAVQAARAAPGQVATLIVPTDAAWGPARAVAPPLPIDAPAPVTDAATRQAAEALKNGTTTALLLRGEALQWRGLMAAGRVARTTGCRVLCDTLAPRLDRGAGLPEVERIPYFPEWMVEFLAGLTHLVLVGATTPTAMFSYPDQPSICVPQSCRVSTLAQAHEDGPAALEALAEALKASATPANIVVARSPEVTQGKFNPYTIGQIIGRLLPEGAIISDDASTSSQPVLLGTRAAPPHVHLALTGGSLGQGLPAAIGAAVAAPDSKVVCLTGDGAGLYTVQALWTMARERLDVTTVVFVNRAYRILGVELGRLKDFDPGPASLRLVDLSDPDVNWSGIAASLGVEASRAADNAAFEAQFAAAMKTPGPRLIEAII